MPAEKSKFLQKHMAEIAFAFFAVSLISTIWESSHLMLNRPVQPDYAAGLVYLFTIKGSKAYISASDANCVSLGWISCILGFGGIAYAIGPASRTTDVITSHDKQSIGIVFLISIVVVAGIFLLFGRWIGDFLGAYGVVLQFY